MISNFLEMFSLDFIQRAFIGGILVALCAALLGTSLVLKRYSMIGDGLSHVGFGALAIATAIGVSPMYIAIPAVIIMSFLLLRIKDNSKIKGDAAIALIATSSLAVGVTVLSFSSGANTDIYNYLFGSILALTSSDIILIIVLSVIIIFMYVLSYNKIFAITFDERFAHSTGININVYNSIISVLSSLIIVTGMKMIGAMLISALIIFPPLTAMRICKTFKSVTICSAIISVMCFVLGLVISMLYDTPTGASIVTVNAVVFLLFMAIEKFSD